MSEATEVYVFAGRPIKLIWMQEAGSSRGTILREDIVTYAGEVPMDYAPPLVAEGSFVAVARPGTLPPLEWDYWE